MKCSIEGCEREIEIPSRGWCRLHYSRWRKQGDPLAWKKGPKPITREALLDKSVADGDCRIWTSTLSKQGYGVIGVGGRAGRVYLAHRLMYELSTGSIPQGLVSHHTCHRPACINPDHLRFVSRSEHPGLHAAEGWDRPNTCRKGHDFTPENTGLVFVRGVYRQRYCRTCRRENSRQEVAA